MDYLQTLGIVTKIREPPQLAGHEAIMETHILAMYAIVKDYLAYWSVTQSVITVELLINAEQVLLSLLTAVRSEDLRSERIRHAISIHNIKGLGGVLRCPTSKKKDLDSQAIRSTFEKVKQSYNSHLHGLIAATRSVLTVIPATDTLKKRKRDSRATMS